VSVECPERKLQSAQGPFTDQSEDVLAKLSDVEYLPHFLIHIYLHRPTAANNSASVWSS
jgi:hypothetical protein